MVMPTLPRLHVLVIICSQTIQILHPQTLIWHSPKMIGSVKSLYASF